MEGKWYFCARFVRKDMHDRIQDISVGSIPTIGRFIIESFGGGDSFST